MRAMPACANAPVPTDQRGLGAWADYQQVYGSVIFTGPQMPAQQGAWEAMRKLRASTVSAAHICSYTCMSSVFSEGDVDTRCLVQQLDGGDERLLQNNTWCPGFPVAPGSSVGSLAGGVLG